MNNGLTDWIVVGVSGVLAIAIDPVNSNTIYAGTQGGGGVFKSADAGGQWIPVNNGLPREESTVLSLAIDPVNPDTLYAGVWWGGAVFKSTYGGAGGRFLWNTGLPNSSVPALAIDQMNPDTLYAGTISGWPGTGDGGVFKTTDGGGQWIPASNGLTNMDINALAIDPHNTSTLYAGTNGGGVFKSTDGGGYWSPVTPPYHFYALAIDPMNPTTIYAASGTVDKSADGGGHWITVSNGLPGSRFTALAIDPLNPNTIYAATYGGGVFKSTDAGGQWIPVNNGLTDPNVLALAVDPIYSGTLYAGSGGGGVFKSTDGGGQWVAVNKGLTDDTWVRALAIDPLNPGTVYAGTDAGAFKISFTESPPLTVMVTAIDNAATEAGPTTGTYRILRMGSTASSLAVHFTMGGTAQNGVDYNLITSPVTIPVGRSYVDIILTPIDDAIYEGNETAILTISANPAYGTGSSRSATITIQDNEPVVTVTAVDSSATEAGPTTGTYRISRTGATSSSVAVHFTMGGTAQNGVDYNIIMGPVTIPTGAVYVDVKLTPIDNSLYEGDKTAILTISAQAGYAIGSPGNATITIEDDEPTLTVVATNSVAKEAGPMPGTYRISRTGATNSSLNVNIMMGGSARNGIDYNTITSPVTIPAGASYVDVILTPINNSVYEGDKTAILTILANPGYGIEFPGSATIKIQDDESMVTVIAQDAIATEAGPTTGTFRILRSGSTDSSLNVFFTMGGTAQNGVDYNLITSPVTIPVGRSYVDIILIIK